jgi:hypothetical protein
MPAQLKVVSSPSGIRYSGHNLVPGLQAELMLRFNSGTTFKAMAEKCNQIPRSGTISKLAYGETKFPRFATVVALYTMLGFTIVAER